MRTIAIINFEIARERATLMRPPRSGWIFFAVIQ